MSATTFGELYAWVEVEPGGGEGIIAAIIMPEFGLSNLQHRNLDIAQNRMRKFAELHAKKTGRPVRLVKFVRTATVEELP